MTKMVANYENDESEQFRTLSKFAGEEFDVGNVRTVFAGASKGYIFLGLYKNF
ncbi:unnamed protein product [Gongylonema pulchrum]|uniref:DUF2623 family protein n=1 Tax=Gongylonema pulchrum TaxID=637853 RepID=A0A183D8V6_9BILA|nr:unnamed protein product [Gongylonema pulchrum]